VRCLAAKIPPHLFPQTKKKEGGEEQQTKFSSLLAEDRSPFFPALLSICRANKWGSILSGIIPNIPFRRNAFRGAHNGNAATEREFTHTF